MEGNRGVTIRPHDCIVIGAGPSGLMAAITVARYGADVLVIEHRDRPLKKLYATGNGRCNFTNLKFDDDSYRGTDPSFAYKAIEVFGREGLLDFMHGLGLMTKSIGDYVYPYNEQARAVADALLLECRKLQIDIRCGEDVVDITYKDSFEVLTQTHMFRSTRLILAAGGKASPTHGSDGSINKFIRGFGHNIILQQPALVPLKFGDRRLALLAGVRVKCAVSLEVDDNMVSSEWGEIIFNKDNISGIPVMQVSRFATRALADGSEAALFLDLFPDESTEELTSELKIVFMGTDRDNKGKHHSDVRRDRTALEALGLCLNEKLAEYCLNEAGIVPRSLAGNCSEARLERLSALLKDLRIPVIDNAGFDRAQVTAGGVDVSELTGDMESKLISGLYIAGELCDIDGTCGGYNLQWAFTSGYIAGMAAGRDYCLYRK
ncbi:MAG: aminoacetone oxidase family FAD-binding enzyme [Lachnospiraceae bacterium]|nr:aminoacetone oxidase family FAD-binding enzyme [Lachnospiraceae bacterium]